MEEQWGRGGVFTVNRGAGDEGTGVTTCAFLRAVIVGRCSSRAFPNKKDGVASLPSSTLSPKAFLEEDKSTPIHPVFSLNKRFRRKTSEHNQWVHTKITPIKRLLHRRQKSNNNERNAAPTCVIYIYTHVYYKLTIMV